MAAGFWDILAWAIGWKSAEPEPLAEVSTRYTLVGSQSSEFTLTGSGDTEFTLVGS